MSSDDQRRGPIFRAGPDGTVTPDEGARPDETATARARALQEMTFSTHIVSLNAMALMHLGEMDGVPDGQRDLDAARHVIDTLAMLGQKTKGNLTLEEQKLLESVVYDLRMKFLQKVR